jgi:hypothetical protein
MGEEAVTELFSCFDRLSMRKKKILPLSLSKGEAIR